MKFIKIIFAFFLPVFVQIIISTSIHRRSYNFNGTECISIYNKNNHRQVRDILKDEWYPWQFPIKYYVESPVSKENVKKAIEIISNNTCLNFTESNSLSNNEEGLIFRRGTECSSNVGLIGRNKSQPILLTRQCYSNVPYILHEIGHALGLIHEHARPDRDKYVELNLKNVYLTERYNFDIVNYSVYKNYSTSYDYYSLMHYHPKDFAYNKKDVIKSITLEPYNRMMGQRAEMTFNEFKQINLCYCNVCNWVDKRGKKNKKYSNVNCTNGGYPDHNNCSRCICPTGYTGDDCSDIVSSDTECGITKFQAEPFVQNLFFDNNITCYILLTAKPEKRIKINIYYTNTPFKSVCTKDVSNQIKYRKDKGNTGLLLCGWYFDNVKLTSESSSVLIIFRGAYRSSGIFFTFKEHNK